MRKVLFLALILSAILNFSYAQDESTNLEEWNFGLVDAGVVLKHSFILKNETAKILKIESVQSSCGCTVSEAQKKVLAPEESTAIDVAFNSKGYSGPVQQFVYVNTDNLNYSPVRFVIKANVNAAQSVVPKKITE